MRKKIVFVISFIGMMSAVFLVKKSMAPPPTAKVVIEPPKKPFAQVVAASGLIEAYGDNLNIGAPESGIIDRLFVKVGDRVKKGDPLFKLNSRKIEAELKIDEAKVSVAKAEYRLVHDQLQRLRSIKDSRAVSQQEIASKENEEKLAYAKLMQAEASEAKNRVLLEELTVRAPIDGVVLQKNMNAGEYLQVSDHLTPPLILGNKTLLQVKADIDEQNASYMTEGAAAVACPKNRPDFHIPLKFVRVEPYVIPKRSLTGSSREKVDTRVLQVVYTFEPPQDISLYVGQQVDVFIQKSQDNLIAETP